MSLLIAHLGQATAQRLTVLFHHGRVVQITLHVKKDALGYKTVEVYGWKYQIRKTTGSKVTLVTWLAKLSRKLTNIVCNLWFDSNGIQYKFLAIDYWIDIFQNKIKLVQMTQSCVFTLYCLARSFTWPWPSTWLDEPPNAMTYVAVVALRCVVL